MYMIERQVKNKKSETVRSPREMPLQQAVGLVIRQATRSKKIINVFSGFGMSCEYNKILPAEAKIEAGVLKRIVLNNGLYLPPDLVMERNVFLLLIM